VIIPYSRYVMKNPRKLGLLSDKGKFKIKKGFKMSEEELLGDYHRQTTKIHLTDC